ncbi:unnamed protein product [Pleuronectes platessa]|uniref:Uncharacterized protein n=1 Tax=Pleuronectes platessa TaxID=8262 RepID=A0A9N7TQS6_PLEPL|nr:unnamed protein product [Pleuronectes platessa]
MAPSDDLLSEYLKQQQPDEEEEPSWKEEPLQRPTGPQAQAAHGMTVNRNICGLEVPRSKFQEGKKAVQNELKSLIPSGSNIKREEHKELNKDHGLKEELEKMGVSAPNWERD